MPDVEHTTLKAPRQRLPNRRPSVSETLEVGGQAFTVCIGFDPEDGSPRELFMAAGKEGPMLNAMLADAAVVISIALQNGIPAAALAKSIGRLPIIPVGPADLDNSHSGQEPASPISAALDLLRRFEKTDTASGVPGDKTAGFLPFLGPRPAAGGAMGSVWPVSGCLGPSDFLNTITGQWARSRAYTVLTSRPRRPNCHRMVCVPGNARIGHGGALFLHKIPNIVDPLPEHQPPPSRILAICPVGSGYRADAHIRKLN